MDEFKPEEDELKPDASDRRPSRPRRTSAAPGASVSRHVMMGLGVLVLLLLVFAIGSALNGPHKSSSASKTASGTRTVPAAADPGGKSIDLSGSLAMRQQGGDASASEQSAPAAGQGRDGTLQELSAPPVSATPTEAQPEPVPPGQQRVELSGDLNSALSSQQNPVDHAADAALAASSAGLPVAPATVAPHKAPPVGRNTPAAKPAATTPGHTPPHVVSRSQTAKTGKGASHALPAGNYTLQLSGASRAESLNSWAKKQHLSNYYVYRTTRNGQPWYVLVSGSYATPADARRAATALPAEVRAQNPWVKPVSQVKKEAS